MYCVIVGDIINSKDIVEPDKRETLLRAARNVFSSINAQYRDALLADFGVVRGYGFEGVLLAKHLAPRIIKDIIQGFYRADKTRVRIAAVVGELSVASRDRNECDGPAFHKALELLKTSKARKSEYLLQVVLYIGGSAQPIVDSQLQLLAAMTGGWTERQRELVWAAEKCGSNAATANMLGIKPSVVSKQLKAASYKEYLMAWEGLEQYLLYMDEVSNAMDEVSNAAEQQSNYPSYYNLALAEYDRGKYDRAAELLRMAQE